MSTVYNVKSIYFKRKSKKLNSATYICHQGQIKHTQMKGKQCNFIIQNLVVLFLHYFYYHCLKLYVLFNVVLVQVRKEAVKQVNRTARGFMNAQVQLHMMSMFQSRRPTIKYERPWKLNPKMPMKILFHYPPAIPSI